jgi:hypothetical protein
MKKIICKILKEEVESGSLREILKRLKKLYPKLDYCISDDGKKIKVYVYYGSNYDDMVKADEDKEEFHEAGVIVQLNDNGTLSVGSFNDYRAYDGKYFDKDVNFYGFEGDNDFKFLIKSLDYELQVDPDPRTKSGLNYEGYPHGWSAFEWREC